MLPGVNLYQRKLLTDPSQFYGRRHDVLFLAEKISKGQVCAISGEPLIGKTSLLYYLIHQQGARSQPEFNRYLGDIDTHLFVLIELGRLLTRNAHGILRYTFDRVAEEAEKYKVQGEETVTTFRQNIKQDDDYEIQRSLERYLKNLKRRVVLLFDDFDIVIEEFPGSDATRIMQYLRGLIQALDFEDRLNCIFVTISPLEQLLRNNGFSIASPLSRIIADYRSLRPLEEDEVNQYMHGPLQGAVFSSPQVSFIKRLAGRHPYLIKVACFYVFEAQNAHEAVTINTLQQAIEKDSGILWLMNTLWQRIENAEEQEGLPLKNAIIKLAWGTSLADKEDHAVLAWLYRRGLIDSLPADRWILGSIFKTFIQSKNAEFRLPLLRDGLELQQAQKRLAPLEYKLYCYLVENSERTCARVELQRAIWGDKLPTSRDALEQLIKRVREKIEPHPEYPEFLLTVRGLGYVLRDRRKS